MFYELLPWLLNCDVVKSLSELWSAKEKTCTPSNLNSIYLAQSNKILCSYNSLILDKGNWVDVCFWTNTEIIACVQLHPPHIKKCCTQVTEIIELACRHWTNFCFKSLLSPFSPLLLHLCVPINISYIETTDQFEWDVVVWSLNYFNLYSKILGLQ